MSGTRAGPPSGVPCFGVGRAGLLASCLALAVGCGRWAVPAPLVGTWSGTQVVSVRIRAGRGPGRFVSDTVAIALTFGADGRAEGRVGGAMLTDAYVLQNRGAFGRMLHIGTDCRLEGRLQGPLFAADPIPTKDIHAPFGLAGDTLVGSIFQQSGMGVYPMVELRLVRR